MHLKGGQQVQGTGGKLNRVWADLPDNAAGATDGHGNITGKAPAGSGCVAEIVDGGQGYRAPWERVFEPSYTTEEVRTGLDAVRCIIRPHGDEVSVRSRPGETRLTVGFAVDTKQSGG